LINDPEQRSAADFGGVDECRYSRQGVINGAARINDDDDGATGNKTLLDTLNPPCGDRIPTRRC
jgi:hypothetical protein